MNNNRSIQNIQKNIKSLESDLKTTPSLYNNESKIHSLERQIEYLESEINKNLERRNTVGPVSFSDVNKQWNKKKKLNTQQLSELRTNLEQAKLNSGTHFQTRRQIATDLKRLRKLLKNQPSEITVTPNTIPNTTSNAERNTPTPTPTPTQSWSFFSTKRPKINPAAPLGMGKVTSEPQGNTPNLQTAAPTQGFFGRISSMIGIGGKHRKTHKRHTNKRNSNKRNTNKRNTNKRNKTKRNRN